MRVAITALTKLIFVISFLHTGQYICFNKPQHHFANVATLYTIFSLFKTLISSEKSNYCHDYEQRRVKFHMIITSKYSLPKPWAHPYGYVMTYAVLPHPLPNMLVTSDHKNCCHIYYTVQITKTNSTVPKL